MRPRLRRPEWIDFWHFLTGLVSALLPVWWWRTVLVVFYFLYQLLEKESTLRTCRDMIMFAAGFLAGLSAFPAVFPGASSC